MTPRSLFIFRLLQLAVLVILFNQGRLLTYVEHQIIMGSNASGDGTSTSTSTSTWNNNEDYRDAPTSYFGSIYDSVVSLHDEQMSSSTTTGSIDNDVQGEDDEQPLVDPDANCPFRDSPLYRSVFVYPSPGDDEWQGDILSASAANITSWPWIAVDEATRAQGIVHYDPSSPAVQYTTELLVRDTITHPDSCLRTTNPDKATLFYVPYLPSVEYHNGTLDLGDYQTSPYGQALLDATERQDYRAWESTFGLSAKYWQRRGGADHILVVSEPLHGLWHPKGRRGNFHFVHSQQQLSPVIVLSVELSTTFVAKYPHCARKNILLPYPNTDGKWFNGQYDQQATHVYQNRHALNKTSSRSTTTTTTIEATLPAELELYEQQLLQNQQMDSIPPPRPLAQYYKAGNHGTCTILRKALKNDFACTESARLVAKQQKMLEPYQLAYRQATTCPCPGGDSPSAKRMFDALHAGCIPLILSHDFVWPFTTEFDTIDIDQRNNLTIVPTESSELLHPHDFSIRLEAQDFEEPVYENPKSCRRRNATKSSPTNDTTTSQDELETTLLSSATELRRWKRGTTTIQDALETSLLSSATELQRLKRGVQHASDVYAYYRRRPDLPDNPLQAQVLPDGGAAHALVEALAERAQGVLWPACRDELARGSAKPHEPDAKQFKC